MREEWESESIRNIPLYGFCDNGGHDLKSITESPHKKICQSCRHYFEVGENDEIKRELTQKEFYGD